MTRKTYFSFLFVTLSASLNTFALERTVVECNSARFHVSMMSKFIERHLIETTFGSCVSGVMLAKDEVTMACYRR